MKFNYHAIEFGSFETTSTKHATLVGKNVWSFANFIAKFQITTQQVPFRPIHNQFD